MKSRVRLKGRGMSQIKRELGKENRNREAYPLLQCVSSLPKKMLSMHGRDNVIEFVLHDLGQGFNLKRAAYVVDNPDFNCLKGVAGFDREQVYQTDKNIWQDPEMFTSHMQQAPYNQQVRCFLTESLVKKGKSDQEIVKNISGMLGFQDPSYYAWPVKHDNHGLLIYEKCDQGNCDCDYLLDGLCLIGFCPVF